MPVSTEAEVRAAVREAWNEVMPGAALDEGLTWQEAGVDSLKSLHLLLGVETALGHPVSFDLLTRETRIGDLIAILAGTAQAPKAQGRQAFVVLGMFGDGSGLAEFRARLRDTLAFETLPRLDLADPLRVTADLNAMGAFYADHIRRRSTGGPVILAGYSFGAYAALATALSLQGAGVEVGLLCLLDPLPGQIPGREYLPDTSSQPDRPASSLSSFATFLVRTLLKLRWVDAARRLTLMAASMRDSGAGERRRRMLYRVTKMAAEAWRPTPFQGRTIVFASDDFERTGDPGPYLALLPGVSVVHVGGGHREIFEGEALRTIVETLRRAAAERPAS
jgi:thioesterase domain-containing protein